MSLGAIAYGALRATGLPAIRRRRRGVIFCFHNVVEAPIDAADSSLHLPVGRFTGLVDWITTAYQVLPLLELLERAREGGSVGGLAALTADDGYTGFLRLGLPILRARGLPATLFLVSSAASHPASFWWDLAGAQGHLTDATRRSALTDWGGRADLVKHHLALTSSTLATDLLPADWRTVRQALGADLTIGSHTATHPNLTAIGTEAVRAELREAKSAIRAALDRDPEVVSYPYGLATAEVAREANDAGYRFGLELGSQPIITRLDPHRVPRINVPATVTAGTLACWSVGLRWKKPR